MVWRIFFGNEAADSDQGGFCDRDSEIHYCNESKEATLNKAAQFEEHGGSDVRTADNRDPNDCPDSTRFNTTILEVDNQGFETPAKYDPGR
jgi:hypothetical protein